MELLIIGLSLLASICAFRGGVLMERERWMKRCEQKGYTP